MIDIRTEAEREDYEERAAIREFDGGLSRAEAEALARAESKENMFRCMVRQLIQWAKSGKRADVVRWLDRADLKVPRPQEERKRYADAINEQIKLKNQGRPGEWITKEPS
jgi:uncharacterized membrane-anchored protein